MTERRGRGAQKVNRVKMFRNVLAHRGSLRTGEYEVQNELRCVFKCSLAPNGGKQRSFKNRKGERVRCQPADEASFVELAELLSAMYI